MSEPHELLTVEIYDQIMDLIPSYATIAKQRQQMFKNDSKQLHNYILTQIVDLFNSIKHMIGDQSLINLLAEKGGEEDYGSNFSVKNKLNDFHGAMKLVKSQLLGDLKIKEQKNIYHELLQVKNALSVQQKAMSTQLQQLPEIQQQVDSIDKLLGNSFNLLEDIFTRQDDQRKDLLQKLDDFDERFFSRFQEFEDKQSANSQIQQQQVLPQVQQQVQSQPKITIVVPPQLEEEKTNEKAVDELTLKAIDAIIEGAFKYPLEVKLLQTLNEQKQQLKGKDTQKTKHFDYHSQLMHQFLNDIMSSGQFSDPNDEVKAKAYVESILNRLNPQNYDHSMIFMEKILTSIFVHMDKAKGSFEQPTAIAQEIQQVPETLAPVLPSHKHIYSIIKTREFNHKGDFHTTIIKATNGKVMQGGTGQKLYFLSSDLKLIKTTNISGWLFSGIAIGKRLFCGQYDDKVTVFDEDTLTLIATINTQAYVKTMLLIQDNYLLIGQNKGYIDIIQLSTLQTIFQSRLSQQTIIYNMIKTSNPNEYAIALDDKGIVIIEIVRDSNNNFSLLENTTESYFNDKNVRQLADVQSDMLIACVDGMKDLQVIDRKSKQVMRTIPNVSINGICNSLQKVIGYDDETFPYLLLKDKQKISVINSKTFTAVDIIQSQYDDYCWPNSMVQYQDKNQLRLLTLYWNRQTEKVSTKEFVIGSLP